ncbi:MAG TPA: WD40 repeat domain-containing serine/threonine-protein kinase, partial [Allocoleopsis sp.]
IKGVPQCEDYFIYHHTFPNGSELILHCLVMEKVEGINLKEWVKIHGKISQKQALKWLKEIVFILDKIHQLNWFHRDIKPPNIMMRNNGQLVLIDFGTAREETQTYYQNLQNQHITDIVSQGYTPIEQQNGAAIHQSDFFALGRTFVHLLTGKHPLDPSIFDRINDELTWHYETENINSLLLDFIDNLMARLAKDRPDNTKIILQKLAEIELLIATNPPSIQISIESTTIPLQTPLQSSQETVKRPVESTPPSAEIPVQSTPPVEKPKPIHLKKILIIGGSLLLTLGISQIYGYIRYGLFPLNLVFLISALPSSHFLDKTLTGHSQEINSVNFSPDGRFLASGSKDTTIKIWEITTGKELHSFTGHLDGVMSVNFSPDGRFLASGSLDKTIKIWEVNTGKELRTLKGHSQGIRSINFSPDGRFLASGSLDKTIKIWEVNTGKELRTLTGHSDSVLSVNFTADSRFLASGSGDYTIKIWDVITGQELQTIKGHSSYVKSVNFSPDGRFLASGSLDKNIKIWEVNTGKELQNFKGHKDWISAVNYSADGRFLASGSDDKTIKIWRLR